MANHKRKRNKLAREGCLMCKWYKIPANVKSARQKSKRDAIKHETKAE